MSKSLFYDYGLSFVYICENDNVYVYIEDTWVKLGDVKRYKIIG